MPAKRAAALAGAVGAAVCLAAGLSAPAAPALPGQCWNSPFGGFCDTNPQPDGSFYHCETIRYPGGSGTSRYENCYQACHDMVTNRPVMTDYDYETPC